jgi:hypothetical protein
VDGNDTMVNMHLLYPAKVIDFFGWIWHSRIHGKDHIQQPSPGIFHLPFIKAPSSKVKSKLGICKKVDPNCQPSHVSLEKLSKPGIVGGPRKHPQTMMQKELSWPLNLSYIQWLSRQELKRISCSKRNKPHGTSQQVDFMANFDTLPTKWRGSKLWN